MVDSEGEPVFVDARQSLLCFEYLPQQSIDKKITDASHGHEWTRRYQILNGICDGLYYFHRKKIVHLDLKPTNILLDYSGAPKINYGSWTLVLFRRKANLGDYFKPDWNHVEDQIHNI